LYRRIPLEFYGSDTCINMSKDEINASGARDRVSPYSLEAINTETEKKLSLYSELQPGPLDNSKCNWEVLYEEMDLTLYRRPAEPGAASDFDTFQLRVTIEEITAKELCHHFWDVKYRMDWEVAIDTPPTLLATPDDNTVVLHQFFKTIWPVKARYSTFWSRCVSLPLDKEAHPGVISRCCVINHSTDYPIENAELRASSSKSIFALLDVAMVCETRLKITSTQQGTPPSRADIVTDIVYICCLDPGGWAPVSLARVTAKKEYPRFIRRLSKYVLDKCKKLPLDL
jgi:collagen type IV alpha-3-binding protein